MNYRDTVAPLLHLPMNHFGISASFPPFLNMPRRAYSCRGQANTYQTLRKASRGLKISRNQRLFDAAASTSSVAVHSAAKAVAVAAELTNARSMTWAISFPDAPATFISPT